MSNQTAGWIMSFLLVGLGLACLVQYRMIQEWRKSKEERISK